MKDLLMKIRRVRNSTQQELAEYIGVAYATINRWENGHFFPKEKAQERLFEYCIADQIPVPRMTLDKIAAAAKELSLPDGRMLLYHGSKKGITGEIAPISRAHCDFGPGFYMGEQPEYSLAMICDSPEARFYLVSLQLEGIKLAEIPAGVEWAMLVAYYRGKMEAIKGTAFYERYRTFTKQYDIIVGSVVDESVFQVLDDFFVGNITDMALARALSLLKPGKQYVALTEKGCKAVRVEREITVFPLERMCFHHMEMCKREETISLLEGIYEEGSGKGKYFEEIIGKVRRG